MNLVTREILMNDDDVGKKVYSDMFGQGVITNFDPRPNQLYPVQVTFDELGITLCSTVTGQFAALINPYPDQNIYFIE